MPAIVAYANPEGSSAKTTVAANHAALAAAAGQRVLALDLDPQGNLTLMLGGSRDTAGITQLITAVVANREEAWPGVSADELQQDLVRQLRRTIQKSPAGVAMIGGDLSLQDTINRWHQLSTSTPEMILAAAVAALGADYDLVVMDLKGDAGVLNDAALRAAEDQQDSADSPVQVIGVADPTAKALTGLVKLAAKVSRLSDEGVAVILSAVVPVKVRPRSQGADADDMYQLMKERYPDLVTPPIRSAVVVEAAYTARQPVTTYDPRASVSTDLAQVWQHLRDRKVMP